jgi:hypothetical protein
MRRFLIACGSLAVLSAVPLRCAYDPRAPLTLDLQAARYELGFALPPSELVAVSGSQTELEQALRWSRDRCPECTLLGVGEGVVSIQLGPDLRTRWNSTDVREIAGGWTNAFAGTRDVGGTARVLVRKYTNRLSAESLMRPNPHGEFAPILWADTKRVEPRIYTSFDWGIGVLLAVAAFVLLIGTGQRKEGAAT